MTYGETLADARKRAGLTQGDLAAKVGISTSYLSQIETGARVGSVRVLEALSRELGLGRLPRHTPVCVQLSEADICRIAERVVDLLSRRLQGAS